ncbi:FGGY-family carbohydrate kinase [Chitinophaga sp. LS1]|uniref:FGGY-family carbohydrate kinase n=1 Tax=Chitinophaga sp. LS1 TaxID=3051176 RepID=UPI002AAB3BCB|nr:FGGY family carbohydrate kinase [Chitinophaga sp. LS1]WPV64414.1 FGGY family carbohydrate kinase [Chitinophaga sp. LS1]
MNCIAILDIGKTNKKLFLINEQYHIVYERGMSFPETKDEDGDKCEDIQLLTQWVKDSLKELTTQPAFHVKAMNFSTYGASFVYLNENGEVIAPLYNYLKSYPTPLQNTFHNKYGGQLLICSETASPALGSLNSGLQLYRIKEQQPELYNQIRYALHLPQYVSYLISGKYMTDITSIGCHTMLWDFNHQQYHHWVIQEGISDKLPPIFPANAVTRCKGNVDASNRPIDYVVGAGLHDSSAALIPYLESFQEPFVLISTGTWCITLNPFNDQPLTPDELEQDCLCYLTYQGRPVKAARLFAGSDHEQQVRRLSEYYQTPVNCYQQIAFDPAIFAHLQATAVKEAPLSGKDLLQASRFAHRSLSDFTSYEIAYHQLIMDLMKQQQHSTALVTTGTAVRRIFVDGGFGKNPVYMHMLAAAFPQMEVFAASVAQATAIGAALAIHQHWNTQPLPGDLVEMRHYAVNREFAYR